MKSPAKKKRTVKVFVTMSAFWGTSNYLLFQRLLMVDKHLCVADVINSLAKGEWTQEEKESLAYLLDLE